MTENQPWQDMGLEGTKKILELKAKLKGLRCQHTYAHKNLNREIASLNEIADEIRRTGGQEIAQTPTPWVRSIISTMRAFQT